MLQNRKMTEFKLIIIIVMNERDEGKAVRIKKQARVYSSFFLPSTTACLLRKNYIGAEAL